MAAWVAAVLPLLAAVAAESGPRIPLVGYLCPSCPSAPDPAHLVGGIHAAYTHVIFAFAGWNSDGTVVNQWDAPDKNFTLTAATVAGLKSRGLKVLLSVGGGAGNVLPGGAPPSFAANMLTGLSSLVKNFDLDGVDFDVENFAGDPLSGMAQVAAVIAGLRAAFAGLLITGAPQMTDVYPDWPQVSAGFNRYVPLLVSGSPGRLDMVMPQMYNSWAQVETVAYAETYARELQAGFSCTGGGSTYNVTVPAGGLLLGYPASRSAAGSGFIDPPQVVAMARALAANGSALGGLMTWSIGWDQQNGWAFADAVQAGSLA